VEKLKQGISNSVDNDEVIKAKWPMGRVATDIMDFTKVAKKTMTKATKI
jgi:sulfopyruvate decarboxylase TPP-binding subunit